jgi:hypothetical protein
MRCGGRGLDEVLSRVSGKSLQGGSSVVVQTHGRHGQDTPHVPRMATSGGGDQPAEPWVPLAYGPYPMLRKQGQWDGLTMLRQTWKTKEIHRLGDACSTR